MSEIQYSVEVKDVEKHFKGLYGQRKHAQGTCNILTETATKTDRF